MGDRDYVKFYHYTSDKGLQGIKSARSIQPSLKSGKKNHSHFGNGTYGTSLPPQSGQEAIARNNWTSHWKCYIDHGKIDRAIEVKVPRSEVKQVPGGRDILLHDGPLDLDRYQWRALDVPR